MSSTVYLLCGLPGSGKTTYAKELEKQGVLRLSLDEELFRQYGRNFDSRDSYKEYEKKTEADLEVLLISKIKIGESVALDYGFSKKDKRDYYKKIVEQSGGTLKLLYFKADPQELLDRLSVRNITDPVNNHVIDQEMMAMFRSQFEEPRGEDEKIVEK